MAGGSLEGTFRDSPLVRPLKVIVRFLRKLSARGGPAACFDQSATSAPGPLFGGPPAPNPAPAAPAPVGMDADEEGYCDLETNACSIEALVKRDDDESWTVVNWILSRHNGRWLTDSLQII